MVHFNSSSEAGDYDCFLFETVKDTIVEDDEVMSFEASLRNELDAFVNETNEFSLTIYDDDGI